MLITASHLRRAASVTGFALAFATLAVGPHVQAQEITAAEKLLFQTNHFKDTKSPQTIRYRYVQNGSGSPGFDDEVVVQITAKKSDGAAVLSSRFLSNGRQIAEIPTEESAQRNPALLGFLERDINEMKRLTGGSTNYFRKRIRLALADAPKIEPVTVAYKGRDVSAQKITIEPYLNDPLQDKFPKYVGKRYTFILSEKLPGSVYEVKTSVPEDAKKADGGADAPMLVSETMTLSN